MSSLAPCPFCNCAMEVVTYGAVMKFVGDHDGACPIGWSGEQFSASLSESNLVWASGCWNRRAPLPAEQPSNPVPLTDADRLLHIAQFGLDPIAFAGHVLNRGGNGDLSDIRSHIDAEMARIVGQQTKGGSDA